MYRGVSMHPIQFVEVRPCIGIAQFSRPAEVLGCLCITVQVHQGSSAPSSAARRKSLAASA